ncbi:MAG TPA: hypothetical protein VGE90_01910, partial [Chitinophaga sp.]
YTAGRHHLGLMVTSPLVHLWGRGSIVSDYMLSNIREPYSKDFYDFMASTRQEGLKAKWKMPLSIAAGYAYDYGRGQLYFATEYFLRVKDYNILTPRNEAFLRPDTGDNRTLTQSLIRLQDARKSVINFAVGISYALKPGITGYCALRSDMSYADLREFKSLTGYEAFTAHWNNYHLALGANFKRQKFNFRTGFLLAYGRSGAYPQDVNFDHPDENNLLLGNPVNTVAHRFSAGFMLSYIHNL